MRERCLSAAAARRAAARRRRRGVADAAPPSASMISSIDRYQIFTPDARLPSSATPPMLLLAALFRFAVMPAAAAHAAFSAKHARRLRVRFAVFFP